MTPSRHSSGPGPDAPVAAVARRAPAARPAPAERARTLIAAASSVRVGVMGQGFDLGRHAVDSDGTLLFVPPAGSPARALSIASNLVSPVITAEVVDVAPTPMPDRIRGRLKLSGPLRVVFTPPVGVREHLTGSATAADPVLALDPASIWLEWNCESGDERTGVPVSVEAYRTAFPDVLVGHEAAWLPHLLHEHAELLRALAGARAGDDVRPLAVDRYGLVVRKHGRGGHQDVRIGFSEPVRCACEVRDAFNEAVFEFEQ